MKVSEAFDKSLFWDTDPEKLDWERSMQYIIERVLQRGLTKEVNTVFSRYTKDQIKSSVLKSRSFDSKTANYLSIILEIPYTSINVAPEYY
ncbi:MAG: hypothetical protein JNM88_12895 [Chitinophagaceae bacterium]|nr:hypothetical protein [Chitinophagaceae bacterium]